MIQVLPTSITQLRVRTNRRGFRVLPFALLVLGFTQPCAGALPQLPQLSFHAASVEYEGRRLESVSASLEETGALRLSFARLQGPEEAFFGNGLVLTGQLEVLVREGSASSLAARVSALGLTGRLEVQARPGEWRGALSFAGQPADALAGVSGLPDATGWIRQGRFDASFELAQAGAGPLGLNFRIGTQDLSFDSPEGRYAAEGLVVAAQGGLYAGMDGGDRLSLEVDGAVSGGEVLIADFYRDFTDAGVDFALAGEWGQDLVQLTRISLDDQGALAAEAAARIGLTEEDANWSLEVNRLELAFPAAYRRYLETMAGVWALDGLEVTGNVAWSGQWASGALVSGDLEVDDFSVVDTRRERFAITGLSAKLRPGDHSSDSRLSWRGLLLGSINLGAGNARLDSEPGTIALLEPLELDVLGGRFDLAQLRIVLPGTRADGRGDPDIRLEARFDALDMSRLTAALGWPEFGGTISGEIPGVSLDEGVLTVDGEIRFEVFDGRVQLSNLGIERPFGVLPSLAADVEVENLDLEQLTSTFSFGQIAGRLDGYVSDLRMLDWKPVAFDAWLGTPERQQGSNDISRKAVNRLTTIGGGSPTTALTSPLMRMFSSFSYRRLGLGCMLMNNVCHLRGLNDDGAGVLLLEGAGVPKITIRAFNRNVDWPQMLSNLMAISEGDSIRVGAEPGT